VDAQVLAALARWPNVPAVYGWLSLTARGEWLLRGERIPNAALREFIGRNYTHDERGAWFFQNGPQRVFVALEATPWVVRLGLAASLATHTGALPMQVRGAALLDDGRFALLTDLGGGLVDDRDAAAFVQMLTDYEGLPLSEPGLERWLDGRDEVFLDPARLGVAGAPLRVARLRVAELPARYGYLPDPAP
jgi:hypothetical protein